MKKLIKLILVLCIPLMPLLSVPEPYITLENRAEIPILTPAFAEQQIQKITLTNGLQAYLISDPKLEKSSAAVVVKAGSWEDPVEYPGIAHFLEHMLFLGTKKYPIESEFHRFITQNGGVANAFTASHVTTYLFSIEHNAYPEALDRFSNFFIDPLFNPSGVARELQAIDQEYAKNLENDQIRLYYVLKELALPGHPHRAFNMGNRASLLKVSQEVLAQWYQNHYSANKMVLVLRSSLPIEQMRKLALAHFNLIPNRMSSPMPLFEPLYNDQMKGEMIYIEPIKNLRRLKLIWELPPHFAEMRSSKPEAVVCHILGHEGSKSLIAQLKREKLALDIQAENSFMSREHLELSLTLELTDLGVKNIDSVLLRVFQTLSNLKKKGVPRYIFDELHKMDLVNYQYQQKNDAFIDILSHAQRIPYENLETYPEQSSIIGSFDPQALQQLLYELTPAHSIYVLLAPQSLTGVASEKQEPWLKVHYAIKPLSSEQLQVYTKTDAHPYIDLPEPNPLLPQQLTLIASASPEGEMTILPYPYPIKEEAPLLPFPYPIIDQEGALVYYAADDRYGMPQVACSFEIKTPLITPEEPESFVLGDLYTEYVNQSLSELLYPATLAGLSFEISRTTNGVLISLDGYSDQAGALFTDLIAKVKQLRFKEKEFKPLKEKVLRRYQNHLLDPPIHQATELLSHVLYKDTVSYKTKVSLLKKMTAAQLDLFILSLYKINYIEGMIYGNISQERALDMASHLNLHLQGFPYLKKEHYNKKVIQFSQVQGPLYLEQKSKMAGNAVVLAIQEPCFSFKVKAAQQILMQGMKSSFFTTLRTKQQTGYIVTSRSEELEKKMFNLFCVQSNSHEGRDLLSRFELFIEQFMQEMEQHSLTAEHFELLKSSLLNSLKEPPKSISEMHLTLKELLFKQKGDLEWFQKCVQGMLDLTYTEFLQIARKTMHKKNNRRLAVLISGTLPEEECLRYKKMQTIEQIRLLGEFKDESLEEVG